MDGCARSLPRTAPTSRRRSGNRGYAATVSSLALLSALAVTQAVPARAQLAAAGPIHADNGFPTWFQDSNGIRLDLCLDQNGMCLLENPLPGEPIDFPTNFGAEAFWFNAETTLTGPNGEEFLLVLATEAAFANEEPAAGDQVAFGRIRIRATGLIAGTTYTVTHPYGTETLVAEAGDRSINDTDDVGCFDTPCTSASFERVLTSRVGPFLRWPTGAPVGYIGDPDIPHVVTGSPLGQNYFRVVGGGLNLTTSLFNVSGKLSTAPRHEVTASDPAAINVATAGSPLVLTGTTSGATAVSATVGGVTVPATIAAADASGAQRWTATFTAAQVATMPSGRLTASGAYTLADGTTVSGGTLLVVKDVSAPAAPVASPGGGTYTGPQSVSLSAEAGATIRYTTNGTDPGPASAVFDGLPIRVSANTTIRARAYDDVGNEGAAMSATYTITPTSTAARVSMGNRAAAEGNPTSATTTYTTFSFPVTLAALSSTAVTVNYRTVAGTARTPSDFRAKTGSVVIPAGVRGRPATVQVVRDRLREPNETFTVQITSVSTGATIARRTGTGTINNDD